ncbi:class II glutamine amidotransferase [Bifidobacterium pseudolongum]|uniref:Class II glutamine amidotransferase n=1 Tax=Bifidobacterium pseudolongum subsp. globosum TaxID=1690 RepID=A0A4Q5A351_9BIFI|nr:class II glutamine amidotransferase [Bifidobacterium pseudolongum]RYQ16545.1 class II glutamine amidotransferase [Bifidobacterium pseudolongum subsp. globosum]
MCRLLGYATANVNVSLDKVLGMRECAAFRDLSEIHNDGWGAVLINEPGHAAHVSDGGAPSPETGSALYRNTIAAQYDPIFNELAHAPARGALWHLRLASSNLPLILENQQPFFASGLGFIHNGDISDAQGRNITTNRAYPIDQNLVQSTGGRSDSAMYFAIVLQYLGFGFALEEALAQAVRELRATYPDSSYNCMIQSQDQFIALRAESGGPTAQTVVDIYDRYDRAEEACDYSVLHYRTLGAREGEPRGVVAASTGFDQPESEGWRELGNNQMIVASNRTGEFRVRAI